MSTPALVGNPYGFTCPRCHVTDRIEIQATIVPLRMPADGTLHAEFVDEGNIIVHWDRQSPASCGRCCWHGRVCDLIIK